MTVYYLRADNGAIKIGYSTNARRRFSEIETASPLKLELVAHEDGDLETERRRHRQFGNHRIKGEWFLPSRELNRHIATLSPGYVPIAYMSRQGQPEMQRDHLGISERWSRLQQARVKHQVVSFVIAATSTLAFSLIETAGMQQGVALFAALSMASTCYFVGISLMGNGGDS